MNELKTVLPYVQRYWKGLAAGRPNPPVRAKRAAATKSNHRATASLRFQRNYTEVFFTWKY